jgi:Sec-independent protein secretion pathway component TatC
MGAVNERRFVNQTQPQTLFMACLLLYINAAFDLLFGGFLVSPLVVVPLAMGLGAYGIANDKKWGYMLGVAGAVVSVLLFVLVFKAAVFEIPLIFTLLIDCVLVYLLVHPESRDYQRIWMK